MKPILFLSLIILFSSTSLIAQSESGPSEVRGIIVDHATGEPLIYTYVILYQDSMAIKTVVTDIDGYFNIPKVEPGKYVLMTKIVSHETYIDSSFVVPTNDKLTLKLIMEQQRIMPSVISVPIECNQIEVPKIQQPE